MKNATLVLFTLLLATVALAQTPATPEEQAVDRAIAREQLLVQNLHNFTPLVETYIQYMRPDSELGSVPDKDEYFLGRMQLTNAVRESSYIGKRGRTHRVMDAVSSMFTAKFAPEGFDNLIMVDGEHFDRAHYDFRFVRREFLGDLRTLVYDVTPKKGMKAGFLGRIWVEDQEYNIVRFNGTHARPGMFQYDFHFDSWRQNVRPGLWLPTQIYNEESDMKVAMFRTLRFKSETRLWGYDPKFGAMDSELTDIKVDSKNAQDHSQTADEYSPVQSQRMFENEAEQNLVERLERAGLIAPKGEVDKVLDTVVNNLEITNNLDIQPEIQCRVLMTSPLESFSVGHTIVLSRGLIDTLPDEASLAAVLARELAHIALGHRLDTKYAFSDRMLFTDAQTFQQVHLRRTEHEEEEADAKAIVFLKNSPYATKLSSVGLFLRQLQARAGSLPNLTTPRLGNPMIEGHDQVVMADLASSAPQLHMDRTDQVAALPLGARVKVDAWSSSIELVKARPVPLLSAREKMPFEVTPLRPYLKRQPGETASPAETASDSAPQTAAATSAASAPAAPIATPADGAANDLNMVRLTGTKRQ